MSANRPRAPGLGAGLAALKIAPPPPVSNPKLHRGHHGSTPASECESSIEPQLAIVMPGRAYRDPHPTRAPRCLHGDVCLSTSRTSSTPAPAFVGELIAPTKER